MDIEMTKKCAEAMGIEVFEFSSDAGTPPKLWCATRGGTGNQVYDPLNNDEQAMALKKKFKLRDHFNPLMGKWVVKEQIRNDGNGFQEAWDADLNRAIVECVSKMVKP